MPAAATQARLPERADVIVIGAGVVGCSAAWHLARRGVDTLLLERAAIGAGTTWHAAANMEAYRSDPLLHDLIAYAIEIFPTLEAESGVAFGWRQPGRVNYTASAERFAELRKVPARTRARGIEVELMTPAEIGARLPVIETRGLVGGLWVPCDGRLEPTNLAAAFATAARRRGACIAEGIAVERIVVEGGRVRAVRTAQGEIACRNVVIAAGLWSAEIARTAGVALPLMALHHFYLLTKPVPGVSRDMPLFLSYDERTYGREDVGGLLVGVFDADALTVEPGELPRDFAFGLLPENWAQIEPNLAVVMNRFPVLQTAEIRTLLNGPESFTPDGQMLLGETAEVEGLFVAAAMNSSGIAFAAGAGRLTAEWIVDGRPSLDATRLDLRRFSPAQAGRDFLRLRIPELPAWMCGAAAPGGEFTRARDLERSPLHDWLAARGAVFTTCAGVEEPSWFGDAAAPASAWQRERAEMLGGAGFVDRSGWAKLRLHGDGADDVMRRLCGVRFESSGAARFSAPLLDPAGFVQAMPWALRAGDGSWILLVPPDERRRLESWIRRNGPHPARWAVDDIGADHALIELVGARSGDLRAALRETLAELSWREAMPGALLLRADRAVELAEALAGLGAAPIGVRAADGWRVERRALRFGREVGPAIGAVAAGLDARLQGEDFIGRDAVRTQLAARPARAIRMFSLARDRLSDLALEPLVAEGRFAGHVTSSALATTGGVTRFFAHVERDSAAAALRLVLDGETWPLLEIAP